MMRSLKRDLMLGGARQVPSCHPCAQTLARERMLQPVRIYSISSSMLILRQILWNYRRRISKWVGRRLGGARKIYSHMSYPGKGLVAWLFAQEKHDEEPSRHCKRIWTKPCGDTPRGASVQGGSIKLTPTKTSWEKPGRWPRGTTNQISPVCTSVLFSLYTIFGTSQRNKEMTPKSHNNNNRTNNKVILPS